MSDDDVVTTIHIDRNHIVASHRRIVTSQDYGKTAEDINDACNRLRELHRKMENKRRARANKSSRQSFMYSFVTVSSKRRDHGEL
jgi:hypothetical protein